MEEKDIIEQVESILGGTGADNTEFLKHLENVLQVTTSIATVVSQFRVMLVEAGIGTEMADDMSMFLLVRILSGPEEMYTDEG